MHSEVLALDLGTTTGWAMLCNGKVVSGSQSFKPQRFDGGGMRYLRFSRWLAELCDVGKPIPKRVVFEEVRRHIGVDAAHAYGGFLSHLQSFCEQREIPCEGVPVGTIKKHVTGKGNANKAQMIQAVRALGYCPFDDNEADAIALLLYDKSREVA
jgi:Holliday junction resolvasome RuvABC endonuclease subunit